MNPPGPFCSHSQASEIARPVEVATFSHQSAVRFRCRRQSAIIEKKRIGRFQRFERLRRRISSEVRIQILHQILETWVSRLGCEDRGLKALESLRDNELDRLEKFQPGFVNTLT